MKPSTSGGVPLKTRCLLFSGALFSGALFSGALFSGLPAVAQQTGSISGKVTSASGDGLPGVTVEASGDVLPRARTTTISTS